ncbi:hypothetical protein [Neobacillus ginsengisoli]|uniref:Uncharacterized protein n=1 Tax=Neobacillus ginsengisoli TaxID=904295 RepID=A0ABT9XRB5_9BACI|nr:hypothetical protein [Neobacillus ginsengisoli]MDQ0197820.1 hypothetical protein [Neobacillus ginsengisoli]
MKKTKRNYIPFIVLLVIHSILLGFSFYKSKNRKSLFALLMSNIGFAYLLEYFVLNIFNAYIYKPKILKKNFLDNNFGAILSQAIFLPFTAVFLSVLNLGWKGKLLASIYFSGVEKLFLRLGVYKHNWWKTSYTFFLIPFYFKLSDLWFYYLSKKNPLVRFISLFFMILVSEANLLFILTVLRKVRFGIGRYHSWSEHFIMVPLYSISLSVFAAFSLRKKNSWKAKLKVLFFGVSHSELLRRMGLLEIKLKISDYIIPRIIMINLYGKFRDWVYGEGKREYEKNKEVQKRGD